MRWLVGIATALMIALGAAWLPPAPLIKGIFWQPTNDYPQPQGQWHWIGADTLIVQWSVNDSLTWVPSDAFQPQPTQPDWDELTRAPWAEQLLLGLASRMSLEEARRDWALMARQGHRLLDTKTLPVPVSGYYAPIEFSPDWQAQEDFAAYLEAIPSPRYVSVYGGYDMTAASFADWVADWLPSDTIVLFQDGVGVGQLTPSDARARADALSQRLGAERIAIVLEAFQPDDSQGFQSASLRQLVTQLRAYRGYPIYVFSARHLPTHQVAFLRLLSPWLKDRN